MKTFMVFFGLQFLLYLNLAISTRALAHGWVQVAMGCMAIQPLIVWSMIEHIQEARHSAVGHVGVAAGGACAAWAGIELTGRWI